GSARNIGRVKYGSDVSGTRGAPSEHRACKRCASKSQIHHLCRGGPPALTRTRTNSTARKRSRSSSSAARALLGAVT
ncbi:hypothetical protein CIB84_005863, partial [Bambusicola thoracicus]